MICGILYYVCQVRFLVFLLGYTHRKFSYMENMFIYLGVLPRLM